MRIKKFAYLWIFIAIAFILFSTGCVLSTDMDSLKATMASIQIETYNSNKEIAKLKNDISNIVQVGTYNTNVEIHNINKEIAKLKNDVSNVVQVGIYTANVAIHNIDKEIAKLKNDVSNVIQKSLNITQDVESLSYLSESQSLLLTKIDRLSKDLQMLEGHFEENKYYLEKNNQELINTMQELKGEKELIRVKIMNIEGDLEKIRAEIDGLASIQKELAKAQKGIDIENEKDIIAIDGKQNPESFFKEAKEDFDNNNFSIAQQKFEKFAKDFPNDNNLPEVQFLIGESYYKDKKHDDAILAYDNFLKKYPHNDRAKIALLMQGFAFIELNDKKTGKAILEQVIEKYPKSDEAKVALEKILEYFKGKDKVEKSKKKTPK